MGRPPVATEDEPKKTFVVAPGRIIGGFDGKRKNEGDRIELTAAQAKHFQKKGSIVVDFEDYFNDEPQPLPAAKPAKPAAGATEAGASSEADGGGGDAGAGDVPPADNGVQPAPRSRR